MLVGRDLAVGMTGCVTEAQVRFVHVAGLAVLAKLLDEVLEVDLYRLGACVFVNVFGVHADEAVDTVDNP